MESQKAAASRERLLAKKSTIRPQHFGDEQHQPPVVLFLAMFVVVRKLLVTDKLI